MPWAPGLMALSGRQGRAPTLLSLPTLTCSGFLLGTEALPSEFPRPLTASGSAWGVWGPRASRRPLTGILFLEHLRPSPQEKPG